MLPLLPDENHCAEEEEFFQSIEHDVLLSTFHRWVQITINQNFPYINRGSGNDENGYYDSRQKLNNNDDEAEKETIIASQ